MAIDQKQRSRCHCSEDHNDDVDVDNEGACVVVSDAWRRRDGRFSTSESPEAVARTRDNEDNRASGSLTFAEEPLLEANCELGRKLSICRNETDATTDATSGKD